MGWPEALVAAVGALQVVGLAWIASRQQQVKRDLNGHQDYVTAELQALGRLVRDRTPNQLRRAPGVIDED